jgi:hypothetical protein
LFYSPSIIRMNNSRRMRWAEHVARMGDKNNQSVYIKVYVCIYVCMYVCMFRHNYLSVNGIVSFPLLPDCISIRKSVSREKRGILFKGPKYLRKYVCSILAVSRQRVRDSYPRKPTMMNCNGSVTTDISMAIIDRGGYKRKATDSFKRVHDEGR